MPIGKKSQKCKEKYCQIAYSATKVLLRASSPSTVLCFDLLIFPQACFSKQGCGIDYEVCCITSYTYRGKAKIPKLGKVHIF